MLAYKDLHIALQRTMYNTEIGFGRQYKYELLVLRDCDVYATTIFVKPLHIEGVPNNGAGDTDTFEASGLFPLCICIGFACVITLIL